MYQSVEIIDFEFGELFFIGEFIYVESMQIIEFPFIDGDLLFFNLN